MAKNKGTTNPPSEISNEYYRTISHGTKKQTIRKRKLKTCSQLKNGHPLLTKATKEQRTHLLKIAIAYKKLQRQEKINWYNAKPNYKSLNTAWGYFTLSGFKLNANILDGGAGVIRNIQQIIMNMPPGVNEGQAAIKLIDETKTVVIIQGHGIAVDQIDGNTIITNVDAIVFKLTKHRIFCKWSLPVPISTATKAGQLSLTIIEYL